MTAAAPTVLIAEHDDVARLFLADNLQADGYWPVCAADTAAALELLSGAPDALIVNVNGDTLGVVDAIREETRPGVDTQLPILVLTSHSSELHRIRLLERGADDVLCKPYSYVELRARLGALLRRAQARRTPQVFRAGSLRLDVRSRRAWVGDVEIEPLRGKEYQLLVALIGEPERVFTREELLRSVWGLGSYAHTRGSPGVRVNAISPGVVRTPIENDPAAAMMNGTPYGAFGTPDAIAHAAVYLASDESQFVNGTVIDVDGGRVSVAVIAAA